MYIYNYSPLGYKEIVGLTRPLYRGKTIGLEKEKNVNSNQLKTWIRMSSQRISLCKQKYCYKENKNKIIEN